MPLYEYRCNQCGRTFEKLQKFSDAPLTICEICQGSPVERLLSTPAFHLKGGGWYKDGYGGAAKPSSSTESATSGSDAKTESTKTDAKPAAKTESPSTSTPSAPDKK